MCVCVYFCIYMYTYIRVYIEREREIYCKVLVHVVMGLLNLKSVKRAGGLGRNQHSTLPASFFLFRETSVSLLRSLAD